MHWGLEKSKTGIRENPQDRILEIRSKVSFVSISSLHSQMAPTKTLVPKETKTKGAPFWQRGPVLDARTASVSTDFGTDAAELGYSRRWQPAPVKRCCLSIVTRVGRCLLYYNKK